MNEQQYEFLKKFSKDRHTETEHLLFIKWLETVPEMEVLEILNQYQQIQLDTQKKKESASQHYLLIDKIEAKLDDHAPEVADPVVSLWPGIKRIAAAAALLFAVVLGTFYLTRRNDKEYLPPMAQKKTPTSENVVAPGGNKAVLTLGDGSTIILDTAKNGLLASADGIKISKTADGQVMYSITGNGGKNLPATFNTISTPRGGQFQIALPDGSMVWLNAASSIKFPTYFSGAERKVELTGEAYFEIAKNEMMPFRVVSEKQTVEVLGTHFNINAYADEGVIRTTLLEGSVKVLHNHTGLSQVLKPGQESRVDENITRANVDVEKAIAWKKGYFIYSYENIQSIMRKIERWYDVEVEYKGPVTNEKFVGSLSRFENVSEVLKLLELTGAVHFKLEGRKITVLP